MRQHYRFAVSINCVVDLPGRAAVEGIVTDVSFGGVGIKTRADPGVGRRCTLVMFHDGSQLSLPCTIRYRRKLWTRYMVHANFHRLSEEQSDKLDRLIADLAVRHARARWLHRIYPRRNRRHRGS